MNIALTLLVNLKLDYLCFWLFIAPCYLICLAFRIVNIYFMCLSKFLQLFIYIGILLLFLFWNWINKSFLNYFWILINYFTLHSFFQRFNSLKALHLNFLNLKWITIINKIDLSNFNFLSLWIIFFKQFNYTLRFFRIWFYYVCLWILLGCKKLSLLWKIFKWLLIRLSKYRLLLYIVLFWFDYLMFNKVSHCAFTFYSFYNFKCLCLFLF